MSDENFKVVINLCFVRVQVQFKQVDVVLKIFDIIKGEGWVVIVVDLCGEVLLSKGDK